MIQRWADVITDWKKDAGARVGIRVIMSRESKACARTTRAFDRIPARGGQKTIFPSNVLFTGKHRRGYCADRPPIPTYVFVIDHLGIQQPSVPTCSTATLGPSFPKVVGSRQSAKNAMIKVTGACHAVPRSRTRFPGHLGPPRARVFDAWGIERLACGAPTGRAAICCRQLRAGRRAFF